MLGTLSAGKFEMTKIITHPAQPCKPNPSGRVASDYNHHMPDPLPPSLRAANLKRFRKRKVQDFDFAPILADVFKREIEKPHKQLGMMVELWEKSLPPDLAAHTRLESLAKGTLRVVVDSSARLYDLDRLLRGGLQDQIITSFKGPAFRKIQLRVGDLHDQPPAIGRRRAPPPDPLDEESI